MKDEFRRLQFDGHGNYCFCCDTHPDKCKKDSEKRRARRKLKRATRRELLDCSKTKDTTENA